MDTKCTDLHISKIAEFLPQWKHMARLLGLENQRIQDFEDRYDDEIEQRSAALREWVRKEGSQATYRKIYNALCALEEKDAAEKVLELIVTKLNHCNAKCLDFKWLLSMAAVISIVLVAILVHIVGVVRPDSQMLSSGCESEAIPQEVSQYAEYLKAVYKRVPTATEWPPVDVQRYVNLATVESIKDFPQEKEDQCTLAMMDSKLEEVKKQKKTIDIHQVGLLENGERASCIIVEGIPGIGKSTFSWHLGVSWAQKEILHGYHLVVLLRLRDESVKNAKNISDLFRYKEQAPHEHEAVVDWIRSRR
ncbi:hypothetical protein EMCRGX_G010449, partial [Ephydatia muelleri]